MEGLGPLSFALSQALVIRCRLLLFRIPAPHHLTYQAVALWLAIRRLNLSLCSAQSNRKHQHQRKLSLATNKQPVWGGGSYIPYLREPTSSRSLVFTLGARRVLLMRSILVISLIAEVFWKIISLQFRSLRCDYDGGVES